MADYQAPVSEISFVLNDLLDVPKLYALPDFSEASAELVDAVVEEAGKFAAQVFAPINRVGDLQHSRAVNGEVVTPDGFKEAYQLFVDNGWMSLAQDPEYGGQGLPFTVHMTASEFWNSANTSMALCPMLTAGAIDVFAAHASNELKAIYLPKLISGEWTGTMNLTESHAGSDLSNLKTKATPHDDHYLIKGQKIYITWGEHDMTDNIVHIVLAPLADAPAGVKGLSLFVVPKFLVNEDGSLGERNDVKVVSTEHKLGINASPTCVMSFGENAGAVGYMIGEPGQGLACMFTLMNHARLEVGLEGVGLSERAYQDALSYARERVQGRSPATGDSISIIGHPDVQRMLMQMKSLTDAMRALCYDASMSHDLRTHGDDEETRDYHSTRFALLTPVTKAWCTELVNEVTSLGIQVHGGMGFVEETGVAQHYRDARITSIYEGTNGIQANDLVNRKLIRDGGAGVKALMNEMTQSVESAGDFPELRDAFRAGVSELQETSNYILDNHKDSDYFEGAVAYNYLMQMGYVCGAWYHYRSALAAHKKLQSGEGDSQFYANKLLAARFYIHQMLPRAFAFGSAVRDGAGIGSELNEQSFS
ncbi:acyl-CoA dehydrogenase [Arenicella xantha]|uniref:3-methylmercaptopropionyl-CoA dehydrogenase n=1 Tax=Arenicella xantha TaxID=644221 RepID=A0A395JQ93_9GAMM|nr:acyl-CoA dehydrogenase [Arenicella xantha]RBP50880.1 alkylation response protein AidB-like acyl-CoA dehydrogenase [Arenicella xantha]